MIYGQCRAFKLCTYSGLIVIPWVIIAEAITGHSAYQRWMCLQVVICLLKNGVRTQIVPIWVALIKHYFCFLYKNQSATVSGKGVHCIQVLLLDNESN